MSAAVRLRVCLAVALSAACVCSTAARGDGPIRKPSYDPDAERVELFEGVEREQLSVRVAARDAFHSNVYITNATDRPLTVDLPDGAVAVHVLKQFAPPGGVLGANDNFDFGNQGNGAQQGQGAGQSVGGNFQGQGNNGANQFAPNGFFSIPPGKTVQVPLATVCLDHGRPNPSPKMTYVLRRLEDHTNDVVLRELIRGYDPEADDRLAVQAAAWHRSSGLSWKELAAKTIKWGPVRYSHFTRRQVEQAQTLVSEAEELAETAAERPEAKVARRERR
ncbi:MAG TPA: hypothetical protein VML55_18075 [Planctomycetaceae bacterium]|nr:hypothetical protein [Planctomycetaceae bacterium]